MVNLLKKNKKTVNPEEIIQQKREKTAQQWIPVIDIQNNIVYRKDDYISGMLRIHPSNIDLLSDNERKRIIDALAEGFNGENEPFQLFCIPRSVDLNTYLENLQEQAKLELNFIKKQVLKGYINQATKLATSGEAVERRFYLVISKKDGLKAEEELINRLNNFKAIYNNAEMSSHICTDDELLDVLELFAHPIQASYERSEITFNTSSVLI